MAGILRRLTGSAHEPDDSFCGGPVGTNLTTLLDEPARAGEHDSLGAGTHVELAEDTGEMVPDGLFADEDAFRDLGVVRPRATWHRMSNSRAVSSPKDVSLAA